MNRHSNSFGCFCYDACRGAEYADSCAFSYSYKCFMFTNNKSELIYTLYSN